MTATGQCVTLRADGIAHVVSCPCGFSTAFDRANPPDPVPEAKTFMAIWDTGATATVVTQDIVDGLGLAPVGMTQVHHADGTSEAEVYRSMCICRMASPTK